jgi:hypothetical protein
MDICIKGTSSVSARTGTVSRRALAVLEAAEVKAEGVVLPDPRQQQARVEVPISIDSDTYAALTTVFAGTDLLQDQEKVRLLVGIRSEVRKHWSDARDAFLSIGRALVVLDDKLTAAEKKKLKVGMEILFPFSASVASKLRRIAREVDIGRIPRNQCPGSYATAYLVAILDENEMLVARERGLIRLDVTRKEIEGFRASIRKAAANEVEDGKVLKNTVSLVDYRREEKELSIKIRALLLEALQARQRRAEIRRILGACKQLNEHH